MPGLASPFFPFARALGPAITQAVWRAGWVFYAGLGLVAALVLGGNGVQPADIVAGLRRSMPWRVGMWTLWIAASLPVARAALVVPSSFWLRSLPVPRAWFVLVHGTLLLVCVEAPFALLVGTGGGFVAGAGAALAPMAAQALWLSRPWRASAWLVFVALAAALALGAESALGGVGLLGAALALPVALARAPELALVHRRALVGGGAIRALASAHVATLWRRERGVLARGGLLALAGGAAALLGIRNNGVADATSAESVLVALGGATLPLAAIGVATATWRSERRHRWLLDAIGTGASVRVLASAGTTVAWIALLGLVQALVVQAGPGACVTQTVWGAALGGWVAALVRRLVHDDRQDGARVLVAGLGVAIAACVGGARFGLALVVPVLLAGIGALAAQATRPEAAPDVPPAPVEELT